MKKENLTKRLVVVSKLLITIFFISLFFMVSKLESIEKSKSLNLLNNSFKFYKMSDNVKNYYSSIRYWLLHNDTTLLSQNNYCRIFFDKVLIDYNISSAKDIIKAKGGMKFSFQLKVPNRFNLIEVLSPSKTYFDSIVNPERVFNIRVFEKGEKSSVKDIVSFYKALLAPSKFSVVYKINTEYIDDIFKNLIIKNQDISYNFQQLLLINDSASVYIRKERLIRKNNNKPPFILSSVPPFVKVTVGPPIPLNDSNQVVGKIVVDTLEKVKLNNKKFLPIDQPKIIHNRNYLSTVVQGNVYDYDNELFDNPENFINSEESSMLEDSNDNSSVDVGQEFILHQINRDTIMRIAVESKIVNAPSFIELFSPKKVFSNISLEKDNESFDHLIQIYGNLSYSKAKELLEEDVIRTYKYIDILGFSFSTQLLSLFLSILYLFLLISVLLTTYERNFNFRNAKLEVELDDLFFPFVKVNIIRFIIWVILPPTSVYIALPINTLPLNLRTIIIIINMFNGVIGTLAFLKTTNKNLLRKFL